MVGRVQYVYEACFEPFVEIYIGSDHCLIVEPEISEEALLIAERWPVDRCGYQLSKGADLRFADRIVVRQEVIP